MKKLIIIFALIFTNSLFINTYCQEIIYFKASDKEIEKGEEVELSWDVKGATYIEITGNLTDIAKTGSIKVKPQVTTQYKLRATKKNKEVKKIITINVFEPIIKSFVVPENIFDELETRISWEVENAESVTLEGIVTNLPIIGEYKFKPDTAKNIILTAISKLNKKSETKSFNIQYIEAISGTDKIKRTDTALIFWKYKFGKFVEIKGFDKKFKLKDTIKVSPSQTTQYEILVHRNDGKTETKFFTVEVLSPVIAPKEIFRGQNAKITWNYLTADYVKIANNNKNFRKCDTLVLTPDATKKYYIYAYSKNKKILTGDTINIIVKSPFLKKFDYSDRIKKGDTAIIKWEIIGVKKATLNGDTVPNKMTLKKVLHKNENFVLTYRDGKKLEKREFTVFVFPKRAFVTKIDTNKVVNPKRRIDFDIISSDLKNYPNEIILHVIAVDSLGNFVSNLAPPYADKSTAKKYFKGLTQLYNGKYINIEYDVKEIRSEYTEPFNISMVLDYSGSMGGTIGKLEDAAKIFIQSKNPNDYLGIVKFDHTLKTAAELTKDTKTIMDSMKFNGLRDFGGCTALYAGTDEGIYCLDSAINKNKALVLFTDGYENSSFAYFGKRAFNANQVAKRIRENNIQLFIISYGQGVNHELLANLAAIGGGKYYNIDDTKQISGVFSEFNRSFMYYYEVRIKPKKFDGYTNFRLEYNPQTQKSAYSTFEIQRGNNFDLDKIEFDTTAYWYNRSKTNLKPVSPPQVVALFKFDETNLEKQYIPSIAKYIEYLNQYPSSEIEILGHTDLKGEDTYCQELSLKRADEVKKYFIIKGIAENRISTKGFGKDYPIWEPDKEEWKAKENRRIEIVIYN